MPIHSRSALLCAALAVGPFTASSRAIAQPSAGMTDTQETTATVETADPTTRQILLKSQDGDYVTMVAGPEVRNFAQIKPGDRVYAHYISALAARIGRPEETPLADQDVISGGRAQPGEKPFGVGELEMHRRIRVTGIDLDHNMLYFLGQDNIPRVVQVRSPEMQNFLHTLKVGDFVDVAYREAVMVDVAPAQ